MDRRQFIAASLAGAATLALPQQVPAAMKARRWSVQGGVLAKVLDADFDGTLKALARMGYWGIGSTGNFGRDDQAVHKALKRAGLASPNNHVAVDAGWRLMVAYAGGPRPRDASVRTDAFAAFDPENVHATFARALQTCRTLRQPYAIWASLDDRVLASRAAVDRYIALFNELGEQCAREGVTFAIHNHEREFNKIGNDAPFDLILENTDPKHVKFELDIYWASKAGRDPIQMLQAHPGRFTLCHLKDMTQDGGFAAVGSGTLPIIEFIRAADAAGMEHYLVEVDQAPDPLDTCQRSIDYLRTQLG